MNPTDGMACATSGCDNRGKPGLNIVGYGSFATKAGRRQRYRCTVCRGTLSTNTGTAYSGLRCTRREFDQVASLRVEGMSISATARVTGHSRNTIARWLERASTAAKRFNHRMLRGFDLMELQADELCTFIGSKRNIIWLFATIEVSSRVWAGSVLGRRSDRNASAVINNVVRRGRVVGCPLIATDGFEYYLGAVARLFGSACVYGQVLKTRRNNRVVRVERRVKVGTANRLKAALLASEDSETPGRIQGVVATRPPWCERSSSLKTSEGVLQPSVFRGRRLSVAATAAMSRALCLLRSVPLGKY